MLEEWETLKPQLDKLRPAGAAARLEPLFAALQDRDTAAALAWIADYLQRATAITIAADQEIADLRLTLRNLEYQVTALSDDKAEIERLIHAFSLRTSHEIGDMITSYMELRACKLRRQAKTEQKAEAEADSARADYEDYRDANETARETAALPQLPPDDLKELKRLYRQASQKYHPDKVDAADRAGTARWKSVAKFTTIEPGGTDPSQTSRSSALHSPPRWPAWSPRTGLQPARPTVVTANGQALMALT